MPHGDTEIAAQHVHGKESTYIPIVMEVAGTILPREFSMSPHGDWNKQSGHPFQQHRGSFLLAGIGTEDIVTTWSQVTNNLNNLQEQAPEATCLNEFGEIKLGHNLFKVCLSNSAYNNTYCFRLIRK